MRTHKVASTMRAKAELVFKYGASPELMKDVKILLQKDRSLTRRDSKEKDKSRSLAVVSLSPVCVA